MKKIITGFSVLTIAVALILGICGIRSIKNIYYQEIRSVTNLAGAVLQDHPDADTRQTILDAIQDDSLKTFGDGQAFLSRYGYDTERRIEENPFYRQSIRFCITELLLFLLLIFSMEGYLLWTVSRRQKQQENELQTIAEQYFSEDYQFIEDLKLQDRLESPVITELLVRLGENLRGKTQYFSEERDSTKTLVTDISHQLKTPISALKTCFSLYLEAETPEEKSEFLVRSQLQMDKLETLVCTLIQISRLETSLITLQKEPVALTELLVGAVNGIYHKAAQKEISVETADFEDIPLHLDRKWTIEALVNLLDNAVKYSPYGSRIQIRVQPLFSFVRIELEDKGIGIPPAERNYIFRRFYRGSDEAIRREEGVGVGLYLTRKILEEQGGTVTVHPALEKGSVFVVQLPL